MGWSTSQTSGVLVAGVWNGKRMVKLQPGDFFLVNTHGDISLGIQAAEFVADRFRKSPWTHAGIVTSVNADGTPRTIVEAEPGGTVEVPWHYDGYKVAFSSGQFEDLNARQRDLVVFAARQCATSKIKYAFDDYGALALHALHIQAPGLQEFIKDSGHMICSQEVDYCYQWAAYQLFSDGRWNGDVMPSSLGFRIGVK